MKREVIFTKDAPKPIGPYSQAIKVNGTLFISGQIALDGEGNSHNKSVEEETHQVIKNLTAILKAANFTFKNVCKTTIYLKDMNDFSKVNEIYSKLFEKDPPSRDTIEVARLPKDFNVEISMIAYE